MFLFILSIILTMVTGWTCSILVQNKQTNVVWYIIPTVAVFIIHHIILGMSLIEGMELGGNWRILGNMISNSIIPMCFITGCELCKIRKLSATTICLFLFILLDLFSKITVYTDHVPVTKIVDSPDIHFYRGGKVWGHTYMYELVEFLQIIWIAERIVKFKIKSTRDNLRLTEKAKRSLGFLGLLIVLMITSCFIPNSIWGIKAFVYVAEFISFAAFGGLIFCLGYGKNNFFITDKNDEVVYLGEVPNPSKIKRKFEKLIELQKIHRNPDLTLGIAAKTLNTNSTMLANMIKEEYGMTFIAFIAKTRVEDAMELIKSDPTMPLQDVAKACGFNSAANFAKAFRKVTGMSAMEWSNR